MLGVFKKRWKPKRNGSNVSSGTKDKLIESNVVDNITRPISTLCNEKTSLEYQTNLPLNYEKSTLDYENNYENLPLGYTDNTKSPSSDDNTYPLTPNICVEDGRIEFIRSPTDSSNVIIPYNFLSKQHEGGLERKGQEKEMEIRLKDEEEVVEKENTGNRNELCDNEKSALEARIRELEENLETERRLVQKEKLISSKLQRQLTRKELVQRDADRERRLRFDAENNLKLSMSEAEKCKTKLESIQAQFTRMEDTVRTMVQYKTKYQHIKHDKAVLTRAYENRLLRFQDIISNLHSENDTLKRQIQTLEITGFEQVQTALLDRLQSLEIENCSLRQESDSQRRKYEKCLDDVANQVVRAILSQKGLREEIVNLRKKTKDLETQNRALSSLLIHHIDCVNTTVVQLKPGGIAQQRPQSCLWLSRPRSLHFESHMIAAPSMIGEGNKVTTTDNEDEEVSGESLLRDEGYSTMSSDIQCIIELPKRGLEDVMESQDETLAQQHSSNSTTVLSQSSSTDKRYLKNIDSDLYVSVSLLLKSNQRHSFPPMNSEQFLPYHTIMRSFSDSHLCLKLPPLNTTVMMSDNLNASYATEEDVDSWCSGDWWDADYVQHWLRLDESRCALQQYDTSELEDWTMGSVREDDNCLSPSRSDRLLISPSTYDSWSSSSDNCSESMTSLGVDFTRDFYRLVKFESTKSLSSTASYSSKDYDLQQLSAQSKSNLATIPQTSNQSNSTPSTLMEDMNNITRKRCSNIESYHNTLGNIKIIKLEEDRPNDSSLRHTNSTKSLSNTLDRKLNDSSLHDTSISSNHPRNNMLNANITSNSFDSSSNDSSLKDAPDSNITYESNNVDYLYGCSVNYENQRNEDEEEEDEIECLNEDFNYDSKENSSRVLSRNGMRTELNTVLEEVEEEDEKEPIVEAQSCLTNHQDNQSHAQIDLTTNRDSTLSRSMTSSIDTSEQSMSKSFNSSISTPDQTINRLLVDNDESINMNRSMNSSISTPETVINFNDRSTSKQVIEELNRMIQNDDQQTCSTSGGQVGGSLNPSEVADSETVNNNNNNSSLDYSCCNTGWIHVEKHIDFNDPKARANLLDVMLAASHSSSSSSDSGGEDDPLDYHHLHRLHRYRRQKKAVSRDPMGVLRFNAKTRPSIKGRDDFYVRYGEKEREAVASFDFLEGLSTASSSRNTLHSGDEENEKCTEL